MEDVRGEWAVDWQRFYCWPEVGCCSMLVGDPERTLSKSQASSPLAKIADVRAHHGNSGLSLRDPEIPPQLLLDWRACWMLGE